MKGHGKQPIAKANLRLQVKIGELQNRLLNAILIVSIIHLAATISMLLYMSFSFSAHMNALDDCLLDDTEDRLSECIDRI